MDQARKWTDKRLAQMEKHIKAVYTQARGEITEKWNAYMDRGQDRLDTLHNAYLTAPADRKAEALQKYQTALRNYTLRNQWYRDMVDATTYRLAHVNEIAIAYINGQIPEIYVKNFNQLDPDALLIGTDWTLRNEETVRNLMRDTLPKKELNYAKDMAWNTKQINASVLQGILQGESIKNMSERLLPIVENNRTAATRTARTMVTGAENKGRQDRYDEYEEKGVIMNKVWIATPDGRTRNWHLSMDGQEVRSDEYFEDGLGNELEYPGDPGAPPNTVYNCRCTMGSHMIGVKGRGGRVTPMQNFRDETTFHDQQINEEKARRRGFYV